MKSEIMRINHEQQAMKEKIKVKIVFSQFTIKSTQACEQIALLIFSIFFFFFFGGGGREECRRSLQRRLCL